MVDKKESLVKKYVRKLINITLRYRNFIFFSMIGYSLSLMNIQILRGLALEDNFGGYDKLTIVMISIIIFVIVFGILFVLLELISITRAVEGINRKMKE